MQSSVDRPTHKINALAFFILGLLGAYLSIYQSIINKIAADYHMSSRQIGLMILMHFLGSLVLPILLGEIGDRLGSKLVLIISLMISVGGLTLMIFPHISVLMMIGILMVGGGFAVTEGILTGLLTMINPDRMNAVLNKSQMIFCLGAACGPFLVFGFNLAGQSWQACLALILLLNILALVFTIHLKIPPYHSALIKGLHFGHLIRDRILITLFISIFLYVGIEEGVAFWASSYVLVTMNTVIPSPFYLAAYWLGMAFGRLLFSYFRRYFTRWLIFSLVLSSLFMSLFLIHFQGAWSLLFLLAIGFGFSPAWPVLMMIASKRGKDATHSTMGAMMSFGSLGGIALPFLLGQIAETQGIDKAWFIFPVLLLILIASIIIINRQYRPESEFKIM